MTDLRWEQADKPKAQETLFEDPVFEREPGRGEFQGIEFLHVRAQRIINEVRNAPFGFRYTINAYRGCTHACTYCLSGETPILMADGRAKPLVDVRAGDTVYGTLRHDGHRRFVRTKVLDHWSTVKPAYRVTLEDGTELIASGDHRFLTDRGWKHVTGSGQGRERRPHLTSNNSLVGVGRLAAGPKHGSDYQRGYLCGMIRSDRASEPAPEARERCRRYLDTFGVPTGAAPTPETANTTRKLITWPTTPSDDWCRGFLAGIFDADGTYRNGTLRIGETDDLVIERVEVYLRWFGFHYLLDSTNHPSRLRHIQVVGGLREHLRFLHTVDPAVTAHRSIEGADVRRDPRLGVVSVEPLGIELPMYDITTGTGDFIADGVISHNCFARPSHTYLGLDPDEDFERRIVVKVNAVSLLRSELDRRRWPGELIAMGTNTDPYQRCEGKYRLTRGIVETLAEAANPFSILTKSTLVLRDLPLLAEAAKRTDVRVNLSIGTLDEAVWRATEPGTPHPARRVRAVEALNEAGIPSGVLIAPVLPDISDRPEQLEAVVRACVEAGARSISPVTLHLRPGVKEVFMRRLTATHPHLVDAYRRRYRDRSYAPPAERDALTAAVRDLVRRYDRSCTLLEPGDPMSRGLDPPERRRSGPADPHVPESSTTTTQLQLL
ncbi:MAG: radical SAM protein [Acidimicrobiales bacterium]